MNSNPARRALLGLAFVFVSAFAADTELRTLNSNPFSRPEILKRQAQQLSSVVPVALAPEQVVLQLTATMVSDSAPSVIVNGDLISIGEKIGEMKLIAVMEGKAVFTQGGKKFSFAIGETKK